MRMLKASVLCFSLAFASLSAMSANLIVNPGNEDALVAGEIPGWTEFVGSNWTQRSASPPPFEGTYYFFAGAGASATLRQTVDVSAFAAQIDSSLLNLDFSGRVRSFEQSPADSATITLTFLDSLGATVGAFTSGAITNTAEWQLVSTTLLAPALTRSVQIDLLSIRHSGTNNDGYFDDLSLTAVAVPEPASYALMLAGLVATLAAARRKSDR